MTLPMVLTERQKDILSKAVFEYIDLAQPVSSRWLEERYDLQLSPATIRNELFTLTEEGFLLQPYTSAGRVPTDKGYRFYVDEISEHASEPGEALLEEHNAEYNIQDYFQFFQGMIKSLAATSSNLILAYLPKQNVLWKEGWEELLKAPEFEAKEYILNFAQFVDDLDEGIRDFRAEKIIEIYIGKENPFSKAEDFSIMISAHSFPRGEKGVMAIAGPKRMAYHKNIGLMNSLQNLFKTRQRDGKRI